MDAEDFRQVRDAVRQLVREVVVPLEERDRGRGPRPPRAADQSRRDGAVRAVQVHGGLGHLRTTPVERSYRDARLDRPYEGTSEVQRVIIGGLLRDAGMPRA